ncbi:hypothetical protein [Nostoc sp. FACHB-190]|uniref:hypothetical protein n=1 Tax=Nostoc sp. FACHB-190 TaxID=2692838 RepID=UPI0016827401|nr:hypothetical protein [Nostoc sp. FACHB-190]MBD2303032.1 hypothetical protein [Nostoc sp. FACHB-190]
MTRYYRADSERNDHELGYCYLIEAVGFRIQQAIADHCSAFRTNQKAVKPDLKSRKQEIQF